MAFLAWIAILGGIVGFIVAVAIAVWVTRIWSPAAWREEVRIQRVLRGEFESDDPTNADVRRDELLRERGTPWARTSLERVTSGLGPSISVHSVCPLCKSENRIAESISGIGWPRISCECGAPYADLIRSPSVGQTWAQYVLSDGHPARFCRIPWARSLGWWWNPETRPDGTPVTDLIDGLTPLKWCEDEELAVLVMVGSEAAAAAILSASLPGYVPVSAPSSPLMAHADYSGFAGRDVVIWPDADKIAVNRDRREPVMRSPNYAIETGRRLIAVGATRVRVVDVTTVQKAIFPEGYAVEECRQVCHKRYDRLSGCRMASCPKDGMSAANIRPSEIAGLLDGSVDLEEAHRALSDRIANLLWEPHGSGENEVDDGLVLTQPKTAEQVSEQDAHETTPRTHVVYFIREDVEGGKCKVGITSSLDRRLRALQTGNPNPLEIVHALEVKDRSTAERIENAVLKAVRGAGAKLHGEWFENAIVPWAWEAAQRECDRQA